jgi:hypothetical protein
VDIQYFSIQILISVDNVVYVLKMSEVNTKAFEYANMYAKAAPKGFETAAFQAALAHYLARNEMESDVKTKHIKKKLVISKPVPQDYLNELLASDYDWSATNIRDLSPQGQYLKILKIAKNEFKIDTLSSEDIQKILNEKFRISKTINTIGMSLMDSVGKYVDRIRRGNEYYYRLTSGGEERLQYLEEKQGERHA